MAINKASRQQATFLRGIAAERERIIRELQDAALYAIERRDGTRWYVDVNDAIAIVRGERDG
jgi:hypothetical protein